MADTPTAPADDETGFLPLTRDDVIAASGQQNLMANLRFGIRSQIPPVTDPRTSLIDRGLITAGYLTPEQIREIHRIGELWQSRGDVIGRQQQAAQLAGSRAVEADRAERERIKAQKKAESAARKAMKVEAVAARKATEIHFLGRGVSGHLNDLQSDPAKLEIHGLPLLHTPLELASWLGLSLSQLRGLSFHTDVALRTDYVRFTIPKKSGGLRTLSAPRPRLKAIQRKILAEIAGKLPVTPSAHGFVTGRSILTNAQAHVGKAFVINVDLKDFFLTVSFVRVRSIYRKAGYSGAVSTVLALLGTECPRDRVEYAGQMYEVATGPRGLPQGAPTSPMLANLVCRRLDRRLDGLARKLNLTYTRYADDLTFSGGPENRTLLGWLLARVRHIADDEGFALNPDKTRIMRAGSAQSVTGLIVNDKASIDSKLLRRIRAILHQAAKNGLEAQNRDGLPNFAEWLGGMIAFVRMVKPELGEKMLGQLRAVGGSNTLVAGPEIALSEPPGGGAGD